MKKLYFLLAIIFTTTATFSQSCLPEGIIFSTQQQIDDFQTNYPNCTEIEGYVMINDNYQWDDYDITNLDGLIGIKKINGWLSISENHGLINLSGLDSLNYIGGNFRLSSNLGLLSINEINNLTYIGGRLIIYQNLSLQNIPGFEALLHIGGGIVIGRNDALTSIIGMNNLKFLNGNTGIFLNDSLITIEGFQMLDTLFGSLSFGAQGEYGGYLGNNMLSTISAFNNLNVIEGDLNFFESDSLTSINSFERLTSIGGDLAFIGNDVLTDIEFKNLSTISGTLTIGLYDRNRVGSWCLGNSSLKNLDEFSSLTSIGGDLIILCNDSLVSLAGLESLTSIGGSLIIGAEIYSSEGSLISGNPLITSLSGLDNINPHSIDDLQIIGNTLLETCELLNICNYLILTGGNVEIYDNAPGCNSHQEVEEACGIVGISEIHPESFTIYPNPARNEIFISSNNEIIIDEVNIYNQLGQRFLHLKQFNRSIDVSMLQSGIYILELVVGETLIREKLIIK